MSLLDPVFPISRRGFLGRRAFPVACALAGFSSRAADSGRNPFAYDVERYRKTDPRLVQYEEVARFRSARSSPRKLAMGPADRLYVGAGTQVVVVNDRGEALSEIECGGTVRSLAVAADGRLYAGHRDHVEVFEPKGKRQAQWEKPKGRPYLTGIAVGTKDVFVADAGNRVVLRYDLEGKLLGRIGAKDPERHIPGLILPSPFLDVEIAPDGLLRVNNPGRHRVEAYTVRGDLETFWGKPSYAIEGFCGCCNPVNLALLPDGRVVTFEKGLPRVKVYGADGTFECVVAGPEMFGNTAESESIRGPDDRGYGGLDGVVDSQGRVFILDLLAGDIRVMRRKATAWGIEHPMTSEKTA